MDYIAEYFEDDELMDLQCPLCRLVMNTDEEFLNHDCKNESYY